MSWLTLGTLDLSGGNGLNWQQTPVSAIDQDIIRLTFINNLIDWRFHSKMLIRRKWDVVDDIPHVEQAQVVTFAPQRIILNFPIAPGFVNAGLAIYRLEVKKKFRWVRGTVSEPNVFVLIEAQ